MKITILPFDTKEDIDVIHLHNLIKRCEEDLLCAYPSLKEVVLQVRVVPSITRYRNCCISSHTIDSAETIIKLTIATYQGQSPKKVYEVVANSLQAIKNDAYISKTEN